MKINPGEGAAAQPGVGRKPRPWIVRDGSEGVARAMCEMELQCPGPRGEEDMTIFMPAPAGIRRKTQRLSPRTIAVRRGAFEIGQREPDVQRLAFIGGPVYCRTNQVGIGR